MKPKHGKGIQEIIDEFLVELDPARIEEAQKKFLERPKVKMATRIGAIGTVASILLTFVYFPIGFVLFLCCWCVCVYLLVASGE